MASYWSKYINNKPDAPIVKGRKYTIGRHNINWPIPQSAIDANLLGKLGQNPGYDGYDPTVKSGTHEESEVDEQIRIDFCCIIIMQHLRNKEKY